MADNTDGYLQLKYNDPLYKILNCFDLCVFRFIESWCSNHTYFEMSVSYLKTALPGNVNNRTVVRSLDYLRILGLLEKIKYGCAVLYKPRENGREELVKRLSEKNTDCDNFTNDMTNCPMTKSPSTYDKKSIDLGQNVITTYDKKSIDLGQNVITSNNNNNINKNNKNSKNIDLGNFSQNSNASEKPKTQKFIKPKIEEVKELMAEKLMNEVRADIESQKFINHYESNGWKVGKNPMKNWRAAVAQWCTRIHEEDNKPKPQPFKRNCDKTSAELADEGADTFFRLFGVDLNGKHTGNENVVDVTNGSANGFIDLFNNKTGS